jgi:hypothetical protein
MPCLTFGDVKQVGPGYTVATNKEFSGEALGGKGASLLG